MRLRVLAPLTGLVLCASIATAAPPTTINYQGVLRDDVGAPMTGGQDLTFRIFDDETAGQEVWSEPVTVDAVGGVFEAVLGLSDPLVADLFDGGPLWLQLEVGTEVLSPRQLLTSVPWALRAGQSDLADVATTATHATTADTATALAVPTPTGALVPVGGIIDYFAFDIGAALPEGFEVCDGSTVVDVESPWFGMSKPNLIDQFVLGVATAAETGDTGGTNTSDLSHDHSTSDHSHGLPSHAHTAPSHDHSMAHTHAGPSHTHDLNNHRHNGGSHSHSGGAHTHGGPSHTHSVGGGSHSHSVNNHRHKSAFWNTSVNRWQVRDSGGGSISLKGTNVLDGTGDDYVWSRGAGAVDESEYTWSSGPGSTNAGTPATVTSGSASGTTGGASGNSTGSSGTQQGGTPSTNSSGSGGTGNTGGSSAGSTGSGGATATTSSSGTSDAAGASTTGDGGLAAHDNRPAYVGLLKLIRVR